MKLFLKRLKSKENVTLGVLYSFDGLSLYATLELAWKDNQQQNSCIPVGVYKVVKWNSPKFGRCLKILDVPGREDILFHTGNSEQDTKGCVLVASIFKDDKVLNSRSAFVRLLAEVEFAKEITLEIY